MPDYNKAKKEAQKLLNRHDVEIPPIDVDTFIKDEELSLKYVNFSTDFSDVSGFVDIEEKSIYVNALERAERQHFTKAHELGHWILHKEIFKTDPSKQILLRRSSNNTTSEEKEANTFAAALLIPESILKKVIIAFNKPKVEELARIFQVSLDFMGYRIRDIVRYGNL
jgi:Zn-dependent peptidase ImmA (M78 family)